jgi:hypothetical protein
MRLREKRKMMKTMNTVIREEEVELVGLVVVVLVAVVARRWARHPSSLPLPGPRFMLVCPARMQKQCY